MHWYRNAVIVLSLTLLTGGAASGQDEQRPKRRPGAAGPLVPAGLSEKLNLTAEQKDKLAKVEKEFADKTKDVESKIRVEMEKARADKDRAAMRKAQEDLAEAQKVRATYEAQVRDLLTAEQKKAFAQVGATKRATVDGPQFIPPALQQRLGLSAEQQQKLEQLQKEFEGKAMKLLTDEQRTKLEEIRKARPRRQPLPRQQSGPAVERSSALPPPAAGRLGAIGGEAGRP
jgi:Spy/CpxP family protein refolding chaperone